MANTAPNKKIMIMVSNVFVDEDVKLFQFDVAEVKTETADFLIKRKQAKATKDDETVLIGEDDGRMKRVAV